jgi:hypothetical protein
MKTTLLSFGLMLGLTAMSNSGHAQITINAADFPTEQVPFRTSYYFAGNISDFTTPTMGANQVWDFQNIEKTFLADFDYFTTNDPFFPESYHYEAGAAALSSFYIKTDYHYSLDQDGYFMYAKHQYDTTYSIAAATGSPGDNVHFPEHKQIYSVNEKIVALPLAFGDTWIDDLIRITPFEITVGAFGLNNTPGYHQRSWYKEAEVTGYGKLMMTDSAGNASDSMDVLQVTAVSAVIDSFFIGGQPAPAALLAGLGLTQGATFSDIKMYYYRKGYGDVLVELSLASEVAGTPISSLRFNENGAKEYVAPTPEGIADFSNKSVNMFPNPAVAGSVLNLTSANADAHFSAVRMISMDGREVLSNTFQNMDNSAKQLTLPNNLAPGVYFVQVLSNENEVLVSKQLTIIP